MTQEYLLLCHVTCHNCLVTWGHPLCHLFSLVGRGDNRAVTELSFAPVTTKNWENSGVFGFYREKFWQKSAPPPNHFLEIQLEIHFFSSFFLNMDKKNLNCKYIGLYQKTAFWFDFEPREVPQPENKHFYFHTFSDCGTSQSPKLNPKAVFC